MKRMLATLAIMAALPAGAVLADDDCPASPDRAQSWDAVVQLARDYDWTITSMEMDDGCYELRVTDVGGNSIKAEVDPATLQVIEAKLGHSGRDGKAPAPEAPAAAPAATASAPAN
ncbi:PepSY domain-containing protein [Paracoccus niistensis]|uniref:PepSY domain-containing protein n=1 Tax=Paracoccus niistensis TaxID=632935 RepID=A0ABV6HZT4_9RHOB